MKFRTIVFALFAVFTASVFAQQQVDFLIADGSSSGTYKQFLKELTPVFAEAGVPLTFKEVDSSGAVENLDKLVNNEVMAAFMHADVIYHRSKNEPTAKLEEKFQTLVALFPEDIHFVALTVSKRQVGGTLGFGAKPVVINDVSDLKGCKVGAAGGGFITANVIKLLSDVPYEIVKYNSGSDVLKALDAGEVDAVVFVGAAPLPNLKDLGADHKILPIPSFIGDKLKMLYHPSQVTYTKMSAQPVTTVSVPCLLVSRVYKSKKMVTALTTMRTAFYNNLDTLKETPGNHKKWQDVSPDEHGPWNWLNLGDGK